MRTIQIPLMNNELAHRQVKALMKQHKTLDVRLDESFASVSTTGLTGLQYMLTPDTWQWILTYLNTGDCEDFGIFPSNMSDMTAGFPTTCLKQLIEKGCNIARIPFLRETEACIKLRGLFKHGKLFFSIKRNDEFMDYLNDKGL